MTGYISVGIIDIIVPTSNTYPTLCIRKRMVLNRPMSVTTHGLDGFRL